MKKIIWTWCLTLAMVIGTLTVFTGCDNKGDNETTAEQDAGSASTGTTGESLADDVTDAADDIADGAMDAADDIANGFDNYDDAHDYLLERLGKDDSDARYEVRNAKKGLSEYKKGAKGYYFEVYDTSGDKDKKYGDFYVDRDNGKVYRKNTDTEKIEEYKMR
jgi:hypothetical protein